MHCEKPQGREGQRSKSHTLCPLGPACNSAFPGRLCTGPVARVDMTPTVTGAFQMEARGSGRALRRVTHELGDADPGTMLDSGGADLCDLSRVI